MSSSGEIRSGVTLIKPSYGWLPLNLRSVWEYRDLLHFLTWRDVKVRYKQTALGVTWAIIQPLLVMGAFSIFFGRLAKIPSDGHPFPIFALSGLIPWQLFAHALAQSSNSLVANERLITKIFFPRLLIPLSAVLSGLIDFVIAFVIVLVLLVHYEIAPTMAFFSIPFFVLLTLATALAVGLWFSALNVTYRDVRHAMPFIIQFWLFVSPVAYPTSLVPNPWNMVYALNPMVGVIEGFRWALLGKTRIPGWELMISVAVVAVLLIGGLYYFRRMEKTFADIL
jgi:lipopolysaccharide transport system permease protein